MLWSDLIGQNPATVELLHRHSQPPGFLSANGCKIRGGARYGIQAPTNDWQPTAHRLQLRLTPRTKTKEQSITGCCLVPESALQWSRLSLFYLL